MCTNYLSNQHKTHVLNIPGDYSCDEDFQFEMALWDDAYEFWRDISLKFRGKDNKNECTEIIISSWRQDYCHIYDTTRKNNRVVT